MSEKRKWFDPANKHQPEELQIPKPIMCISQLTAERVDEFRRFLDLPRDRHSPLVGAPWSLFDSLLSMPPRARLARNLKCTISRLAEGPIESIMRDGLMPYELTALVALEKMETAPELRVTAQALLNIYERYQLALFLGILFQ